MTLTELGLTTPFKRLLAVKSSSTLTLKLAGINNSKKPIHCQKTQTTKNVLSLYQQIITTEPGKRTAAVNGSLNAKYGEIDTSIRVHLLLEQARVRNTDSATIISNMLGSWEKI